MTLKQNVIRVAIVIAVLSAVSAAVGSYFALNFYRKATENLPDVKQLRNYESALPTVVYSRDSVKIGEIFEERRYPVTLAEISPHLKNAFLAAEDARFYEHSGIDYQGVARAAKSYLLKTKLRQGGSTITQQLAKTLLLTKERTLERKLKDMLLAREIEKSMSKDEILELYLNTIFLGNNSYGVEAAARNYFRKSSAELSLAEAAMIAGVNSAPSAFAPTESFEKAKFRQKFVLEQMVKNGWASQEDANAAFGQVLKVHYAESPNTLVAPYFFIEVQKQLENDLQIKDLSSGGYRVYTSLDTRLQAKAQKVVEDALKTHDSKKGYRGAIKRHGRDFEENLKVMIGKTRREDEHTRAIVVDLYPKIGAAAIVTQEGLGLLLEEDHTWALARAKSGERKVLDFADIVRIGDEVHVKRLERGTPKRIERNSKMLKTLAAYSDAYTNPPSYEGVRYFSLSDTEAIEAAVLVMDSHSGEVYAMVGGSDFSASQFNRAVQAKRQIGSSVKPLYYAYAQDHGFSPASKISSPPLVLGDWKPENYSKEFIGETTLRTSLIHSYNISSIQLFQTVGSQNVLKHMRQLGFSWPSDDLSIALGSGDATLLQVVQAYSPFANEGRLTEAVYITRIENRDGETIFESDNPKLKALPVATQKADPSVSVAGKSLQSVALGKGKPVLSSEAAYVTMRMMQDVIRFGTGKSADGASPYAAGKTGTTNNYTDAWFLGVVPNLVAGVWVGFDDARKSLGNEGTGGKMAGPIWRDVVKEATTLFPNEGWQEPPGISHIRIDYETGDLAVGGGGVKVPVVAGTEPSSPTARNALGIFETTPGEQTESEPFQNDDAADSLRDLE